MKKTPHIGRIVAAVGLALGLLASPGAAAAADATTPRDHGYRAPSGGPNDNDYHANYHADYGATQDGRPSRPPAETERRDARDDARRFQDGDRYPRSPSGWRR
jgi:Ni/Co efflux regulator RcnB